MWLVGCQVDSEQRPHKVSFYVDKPEAEEVIKTLTEKFKERQVRNITSRLLHFLYQHPLLGSICRSRLSSVCPSLAGFYFEIAGERQDYI